MGSVGAGKDGNALLTDTSGESVMHRCRRVQPEARVAMLVVVPREEVPAESAAIFDAPEAVGKFGRYFIVLNCDSENGLSLETCGRECDFVTPMSAIRYATDLLVIAGLDQRESSVGRV